MAVRIGGGIASIFIRTSKPSSFKLEQADLSAAHFLTDKTRPHVPVPKSRISSDRRLEAFVDTALI